MACLVCGETLLGRRTVLVEDHSDSGLQVHKGCARTAVEVGKRTPTATPVKADKEHELKTLIPVQTFPLPPEPAWGEACSGCLEQLGAHSGPCVQVTWQGSMEIGWMNQRCSRGEAAQDLSMESPPPRPKAPPPVRPAVEAVRGARSGGRCLLELKEAVEASAEAFSPAVTRGRGKAVAGPRTPRATSAEPATAAGALTFKPAANKAEKARGFNRRGTRTAESISEQRMAPFRRCVLGECGVREEGDVRCIGCQARPGCESSAHAACLGLTPGQLAQNLYRCLACRMAELGVEEEGVEGREELVEHLTRSMVEDHTVNAAGTDKVVRWVRALAAECEQHLHISDVLTAASKLKLFGEYLERTGRAASVTIPHPHRGHEGDT